MERNWFSNEVIEEWNRLGNHVVSAESIRSFKRRLDWLGMIGDNKYGYFDTGIATWLLAASLISDVMTIGN